MTLLVTDAIVLHAFSYLESSRIIRLATREAGVQSVIAKGARRARSRYGSALDLFAEGSAQLHVKPSRDLQTLASFDVTRARPQLAADLDRFTAASALAELVLRFTRDEGAPPLYDILSRGLDRLGRAQPGEAKSVALGIFWRIVSELGFTPAVDSCASCHTMVPPERSARFSHPAGGVLCDRCAESSRASRTLPPDARAALRGWLADEDPSLLADADARAHQRLLREFLAEHLGDGKPLGALEVWERGDYGKPAEIVR